ncbi:MAG: redoxin family protein [Verrucomicrobiota bacterium]
MNATCCLLVLLCASIAFAAPAGSVPVVQREGQVFVSASGLARLGFAIKELPGRDAVVACLADRCAPLKQFRREGADVLVPIDALCQALGLGAAFDDSRSNVVLTPQVAPVHAGAPDVGQLAPDFKLARLDGTPVALSDFRGKRVLINSWASW